MRDAFDTNLLVYAEGFGDEERDGATALLVAWGRLWGMAVVGGTALGADGRWVWWCSPPMNWGLLGP
jgi:hypothetical protein